MERRKSSLPWGFGFFHVRESMEEISDFYSDKSNVLGKNMAKKRPKQTLVSERVKSLLST